MQVGQENESDGEATKAIDIAEKGKEEGEDICLQISTVRFPFLAAALVQSAVATAFAQLASEFFRLAVPTLPVTASTREEQQRPQGQLQLKTEKEETVTSEDQQEAILNLTSTPSSFPSQEAHFKPMDPSAPNYPHLDPFSQLTPPSGYSRLWNPFLYLSGVNCVNYPQTEAEDLSLPRRTTTKTRRLAPEEHQVRFKCCFPGCTKAFPYQYHLINHYRVHTGEKPFKCNHPGCLLSFARQSSLLNHKKVHVARHMRRIFPCSFQGCNKTFLKASSLTDHMNVHLGKRPYVCKHPGCGKSFRCRSNLSGHRRVHYRDWVEHQEKDKKEKEDEEGKEVKATHR
ncbi:unnamed protein product [Schistocephalus solidus]|uniref:Zinc finger protein n=1 Tax=Schistocephalus solidus TaxID=70667 RepID=A0A183TTR8_SCHSO|nr:unnamed protein product [Schistocephalus solidus]